MVTLSADDLSDLTRSLSPEHRTRGTWRASSKSRLFKAEDPSSAASRLFATVVCLPAQTAEKVIRPTDRRDIDYNPSFPPARSRSRCASARACAHTKRRRRRRRRRRVVSRPPLSSSAAPMRPCVAHSRSAFQTDVAAATTSSTSQPSSSTSEPGESPKLGNACVSCSVRIYMNVTC